MHSNPSIQKIVSKAATSDRRELADENRRLRREHRARRNARAYKVRQREQR